MKGWEGGWDCSVSDQAEQAIYFPTSMEILALLGATRMVKESYLAERDEER